MTEEESDECWIRISCAELAQKIHPYRKTEEVIESAKKLEAYVTAKPECEVLELVKEKS